MLENKPTHIVTMENRESMSITGALQVIAYDEFKIILKTDYGKMIIQGKDLLAGEINSSQKLLKLTGEIHSIQYQAQKLKSDNLFSFLTK